MSSTADVFISYKAEDRHRIQEAPPCLMIKDSSAQTAPKDGNMRFGPIAAMALLLLACKRQDDAPNAPLPEASSRISAIPNGTPHTMAAFIFIRGMSGYSIDEPRMAKSR